MPGFWSCPGSQATDWQKARVTNSTANSFAARVSTTTVPADDGVVDIRAGGSTTPTWLMLVPYGVATSNDTFDVRVIGWRKVSTLWVPTILVQFSAIIGAATGVAGAAVLDTELFADTLSDPPAGMGSVGVNCQPSSPANDTVAHYLVDTRGCEKIEILFDRTGTPPTSVNCLLAQL